MLPDRRGFLAHVATRGITLPALAGLLASDGLLADGAHLPARAQRCIFIFLAGGLSQVDLFDPKPRLADFHGRPLPASLTENTRFAFLDTEKSFVMTTPWPFRRYGQSGMELSTLLPHLGSCADDLCLVRSLHHNVFAHAQAELMILTGRDVPGHPTVGSWLAYGLGQARAEVPAFAVLVTGAAPVARANTWGSGYLPQQHAGLLLRNQGEPILNLASPPGVSVEARRRQLDALAALNRLKEQATGDAAIGQRIAAYELAFRMQSSAPDLVDLNQETQRTLSDYGVDRADQDGDFARNCLLARRLIERGVRYVMVAERKWDHHKRLVEEYPNNCREIDQPLAALLRDLKQRGLLDSTLVVIGGEFGRTALTENVQPGPEAGRDHHPFAYSILLAGGGVPSGKVVGATDDFGWNVTADPIHLHDFNATLLHLFGLDHRRLTFRHQGLDMRLTDQGGQVVAKLLAGG